MKFLKIILVLCILFCIFKFALTSNFIDNIIDTNKGLFDNLNIFKKQYSRYHFQYIALAILCFIGFITKKQNNKS